MASDIRQLILIHQRTQDVLAEFAAHLQLGFVVEQLQKNAVDATPCTASERRAEKNSLDMLAIATSQVNVHQICSELALHEVSLEIFVENTHNLHKGGHENLWELSENLLRHQLIGKCGNRRVGIIQCSQNAAKQNRLQFDEIFL